MDADPYATHTHVLAALAKHLSVRSVLELGGGLHSTPLFLDRAVFPDLAILTTVETDAGWAERVRTDDGRHVVLTTDRAARVVPLFRHLMYDLILVDDSDSMGLRVETLRAVSAARPWGLVVIHDFEHDAYREAACFDHIAVSQRRTPWTAVAWNEDSGHGGQGVHRVVADA